MEEKIEDVIEVQENTKVDEERKWCVYCHTNKVNGKKYFGITSRPVEDRWKNGHGYRSNQIYFYRAIEKYTWDGFDHEIIARSLSELEAKEMEAELIALYKTNCRRYYNPTYGYNMTDGGDGSSGRTHTEETRNKISDALVGREISEETKRKMSESKKGILFSEEHKTNISNSQIGREVTEETRKKISDSRIGRFTGKDNPNYGNHKLAGNKNPNYGNVGEKHPGYGRKHTTEELQKMRVVNVGNKNPMYNKHGVDNPHTILIYCKELDQIFCGAIDAENRIGVAHQSVSKCCKRKRKTAGKSMSGTPLTWNYVNDQVQQDGTIIQGAITLGYITNERVSEYLNSLKEKEINIYGIMEKE